MDDVVLSALLVAARSSWTRQFKERVGEMVLEALLARWCENQRGEPKDFDFETWLKPNSQFQAAITVSYA
jgi:hypothetical protein